jgi:hypothetical protein
MHVPSSSYTKRVLLRSSRKVNKRRRRVQHVKRALRRGKREKRVLLSEREKKRFRARSTRSVTPLLLNKKKGAGLKKKGKNTYRPRRTRTVIPPCSSTLGISVFFWPEDTSRVQGLGFRV